MIRTALVALDGSPNAEAAVALAIAWARRFDAGLVGLGVLDTPAITGPEPVLLGATGFKRERDEIRLADAHERVLAFLAQFEARCRAEGVRCTLLEDVGRPAQQRCAFARRAFSSWAPTPVICCEKSSSPR